MNPSELPVFPLNSPLLPACQMPLQIFEKRYLDMVSHCLRTQMPFVVALLQPGAERHEVITPDLTADGKTIPFYPLGTAARIVDFEQRDNGLLGITIAGEQRMELRDIHQNSNGLWKASATPRPEQPDTAAEDMEEWRDLLEQLLGFSGLEAMRAAADLESPEQITNYLIMLLPLPAPVKQELIATDQPAERRAKLANVLALLATPASPTP
jgi:hypothetical protein